MEHRTMSHALADFRYALRALRRQPTFVLIAVLTLTLGIGANTAIFSVVKTVLLNPLPYDDPEQIVVLWETNPEGGLDQVSIPTFLDWQSESKNLESVAAYRQTDLSYAGGDEPRDVPALRATPDLFNVLSAGARVGRTFVAEEATVGADRVVVLSHRFWEESLGGREGLVGTTVVLGGDAHSIVGIMPPGFEFPTATAVEVWTPLAFDPNDAHGRSRRSRSLMVVGRMTPDAGAEQTQQEMTVLADRIATEYASTNEGWGVRVVAAHEQLVSASRPALLVLMGAVGFLLLIVCANMANLLLARLSSRGREMAVRGALGASRWELARPVLAESLILAGTGGVLGAVVAVGGLRLLTALPEGQLPRMDQVGLDSGVLLFTILLSIAVAVIFGLLPALHASRSRLREQLTESTGATGGVGARRVLSTLVVVEVALALVLLVGAGLMTRSFSRLLEVNPGFDPSNVVTAQVMLPASKYPERHQRVQFFDAVVARLRSAPGVEAASAVSNLPMQSVGVTFVLPFNVEGQPPPENEDPRADVRMASPGFFETLRVPLRQGRFLDERDTVDSPRTMVINETMARRYFPDSDPIGQVVENPHGRAEVVGVVADIRYQGLDSEPKKQVYEPLSQNSVNSMALVARTERDPASLAGTLQREIWAVDAQQPIYDLSTLDQLLARAVFLPRLSTTLLNAFAVCALLLAALGIYGVLSYTVTQRTREIGLRTALGAETGRTIGLVVGNSMLLIAVGVAAGLVAASVLARSMAGVLFGISPFDPVSFTVAAVVLVGVGLAASLIPARRAALVDPMVALRNQ
jgi:putative ABC transport system permease protein